MTLQQYEYALGHVIRTKASLVAPDHLSVYVYGEYVSLITREQYTEQDMSADLLHSMLCRAYAHGYDNGRF
jgi:hypothetical protein